MGWHFRFQLQGVEGTVLSRGSPRQDDAAVLRSSLSRGGNRFDLLQNALRENSRKLARINSTGFSLRRKGESADHSQATVEGSFGRIELPGVDGSVAGRASGIGRVSTSSVLQVRYFKTSGLSRSLADEH